jgi:hypothetical protein
MFTHHEEVLCFTGSGSFSASAGEMMKKKCEFVFIVVETLPVIMVTETARRTQGQNKRLSFLKETKDRAPRIAIRGAF